jgi:hypothetical protein
MAKYVVALYSGLYGNISAYIRMSPIRTLTSRPTKLSENFSGFSQSLQLISPE